MTLPAAEESHETVARRRKATALVETLRMCRVSAADAVLIDQATRDHLARAIGVRAPSLTTWTLVVGMLAQLEAIDQQEPVPHLEVVR